MNVTHSNNSSHHNSRAKSICEEKEQQKPLTLYGIGLINQIMDFTLFHRLKAAQLSSLSIRSSNFLKTVLTCLAEILFSLRRQHEIFNKNMNLFIFYSLAVAVELSVENWPQHKTKRRNHFHHILFELKNVTIRLYWFVQVSQMNILLPIFMNLQFRFYCVSWLLIVRCCLSCKLSWFWMTLQTVFPFSWSDESFSLII